MKSEELLEMYLRHISKDSGQDMQTLAQCVRFHLSKEAVRWARKFERYSRLAELAGDAPEICPKGHQDPDSCPYADIFYSYVKNVIAEFENEHP